MAVDISSFGIGVHLIASVTYPNGIQLSEFADDADPVDSPSIDLAAVAMGVNGDLLSWSVATALPVSVSLIPEGVDDQNLRTLARRNLATKGRTPSRDVIRIVIVLPNGTRSVFSAGRLVNAPVTSSSASAGRLKSNTYSMMFENVS